MPLTLGSLSLSGTLISLGGKYTSVSNLKYCPEAFDEIDVSFEVVSKFLTRSKCSVNVRCPLLTWVDLDPDDGTLQVWNSLLTLPLRVCLLFLPSFLTGISGRANGRRPICLPKNS